MYSFNNQQDLRFVWSCVRSNCLVEITFFQDLHNFKFINELLAKFSEIILELLKRFATLVEGAVIKHALMLGVTNSNNQYNLPFAKFRAVLGNLKVWFNLNEAIVHTSKQ
ncbi:hypothetical protein HHI36_017895 [Cryptolaemus montrouzieri]|uniref:Uncharacterized protein n=1 Tax=Cryptolaemus montrouzieri TaxID=559131 RepID=A0ABD2NNX9_9CUCU